MPTALALLIGCSDSAPRSHGDETPTFELSIQNRQVPLPDDAIRVRQGQQVELRWRTDEPTSIHLHGYDIEASLEPSTPLVWNFEATATGRFPIEAHGFGHAEEPTRTQKQSDEHSDHNHGHDPARGDALPPDEAIPASGSAEKTLLYFEVHPR
ncbi:MAG: hypothetical protein CL908_14235 [Deltaproteobacteria bacterium]|nr:hypothetical protein [Deltaproteobacteria bacterium]